MIEIRPSNSRGLTEIGWLHSRHSFSFGGYHDAKRMNHGALRVINDDVVAGKQGFGTHPHRNAEIISYVLTGALEHRDSMGNGRIIEPGQFQYMSAGSGVTHSEFNPGSETAHFLQIWLMPNQLNAEPTYAQTDINGVAPDNGLQLIASNSALTAPIHWRADATLWRGVFHAGESHPLTEANERGYLHIIRGNGHLGKHAMSAGDAAATSDEEGLMLTANDEMEFLWFSLR